MQCKCEYLCTKLQKYKKVPNQILKVNYNTLEKNNLEGKQGKLSMLKLANPPPN